MRIGQQESEKWWGERSISYFCRLVTVDLDCGTVLVDGVQAAARLNGVLESNAGVRMDRFDVCLALEITPLLLPRLIHHISVSGSPLRLFNSRTDLSSHCSDTGTRRVHLLAQAFKPVADGTNEALVEDAFLFTHWDTFVHGIIE